MVQRRWWGWQPQQIDWRSAAVLFVGTLFFGVSLVAAFASDLTARQADLRIWLPDMVGCVCFLVSGHPGPARCPPHPSWQQAR